MIIKKIKSQEKRRGAETAAYIRDAAGAEDGEVFGDKVKNANSGTLNCLSENWIDAAEEISIAERAYDGSGNAVSHWVIAWEKGEKPTQEQEKEAWQTFLKHQGMQDHMLVFVGHDNTEHYHSHALVCRLKPEPDKDGQYTIQHFGASETKAGLDGKHRNHEINSAHRAAAEICEKQNWNTDSNMYNKDGILNTKSDPDKIRLGQRIEAAEARTGELDPRRIMAERAVEIFRVSKSWDEAKEKLAENNIFLRFTDRENSKGKVIYGGYIKDGEGKSVKLSALTADCTYKALDARFSGKETSKISTITTKLLTANSAKSIARKIFNESSSFEDAEKRLAERGLKIERAGKTGGYLRFGEGDQGRMKLSALGGKYSINALSKKYNQSINDSSTANALMSHKNQQNVNAKSKTEFSAQRLGNARENAAETAQETGTARTLSEALDDGFMQAKAQDALRQAQAATARAAAAEAKLKELQQKREDNKMMNGHHPTAPAAKPQAAQEEKKAETTLHNDVSNTNTPTPAQTTPATATTAEGEEAQKPRSKRPSLTLGGKPTAPGSKTPKPATGQRM